MRSLREVLIEAAMRNGVSLPTRRSALALAAAAPAALGFNAVLAQVGAEKAGRKKKQYQRRRRNDESKRQND